jgi:hypothetical protein
MKSCELKSNIDLTTYTNMGVNFSDISKHYLETGTIGTPIELREKKKRMSKYDFISFNQTDKVEFENFSSESSIKWAKQLSTTLGVSYETISYEDAVALHAEKNLTYHNEKAFFANGKVYFREGLLTTESVFHEFSHPFVKSLKNDPATKPIFDKLYRDLLNTEEGQRIEKEVRTLYKDGSFDIGEEVFVRALTAKMLSQDISPAFNTWIGELLYQLKQALRKLFGKQIKIHTLSESMSLDTLAKILKEGNVIELKKDLYTNEEIIDYLKDYSDFFNGFGEIINNNKYDLVQSIINDTAAVANHLIKNLELYPNELDSLKEALYDEYKNGHLAEIQENIGQDVSTHDAVVSIAKKDMSGLINSVKTIEERLMRLSNSFFKVSDVLDVMNDRLKSLSLNTKNEIGVVVQYGQFITQWEGLIDRFNSAAVFSEIKNPGSSNEMTTLAKELNSKLKKAKDQLSLVKSKAIKAEMWDSLRPQAESIMKEFNDKLATLKNAPQNLRDSHYLSELNMTEAEYKEYQDLKNAYRTTSPRFRELEDKWLLGNEITEEKIEMILAGLGQDANYLNTFLESTLMNANPIIASVVQHIRDIDSKYKTKANSFFNEYTAALKPYMSEVSFQDVGSIGKEIGFKDKRAVIVNGELKEYEEWTLLNKWKGASYDEAVFRYEIEVAKNNYDVSNSDADKLILDNIKQKYTDWKNEFRHQKNDVAIYKLNDYFTKDAIGLQAREKLDDIMDRINILDIDNSLTDDKRASLKEALMLEYNELFAEHDFNGTRKTGVDLDIAVRLNEHKKAGAEYYTSREKGDSFQRAYNNFIDSLPPSISAASKKALIEKWLKRNTTVSLKDSIVNKRKLLYDERIEILKQLTALNKTIYDDTLDKKLIEDAVSIVRDDAKQPNGFNASSDLRTKVKDAQQKVEDNLDDLYTKSGLTRADYNLLKMLQSDYKNDPTNTSLKQQIDDLLADALANQKTLGILPYLLRLEDIDNELFSSNQKDTTEAFKSAFIKVLESDSDLLLDFYDYVEDMQLFNGDIYTDAIGQDFIDYVNSNRGEKAIVKYPALKDFFEENFYTKQVFSNGRSFEEYVPTVLWVFNKSTSPVDYKTKMLFDSSGARLGLIKIDGIYRTPNLSYQEVQVKAKYVTPIIVGVTQDNKGNWLPKDEPSNKYVNTDYERLKRDQPKKFELLEKLTEYYLKGQENAASKDKLYLAFPKMRSTKAENIRKGNVFQVKRRFNEAMFGRADDADIIGSSSDINNAQTHNIIQQDGFQPVSGTYDIDIRDVSTSVLATIPKYIQSLFLKEASIEASYYARGVQNMVDDPNNKRVLRETVSNKAVVFGHNASNNFAEAYATTDKRSNLSKGLEELLERELEGVYLNSKTPGVKIVDRFFNYLSKQMAKRSFIVNLWSTTKNFMQPKLVGITHSLIARENFNAIDGAYGELWAINAGRKISRDLRTTKVKSLQEQMLMLFEPVADRYTTDIGDNFHRTLLSDIVEGKSLTQLRKWTEMQATIQTFAAMMHNIKIPYVDANGNSKNIRYIDSFELVDNKIQSKKGVDKEYAITYSSTGELEIGRKLLDNKRYIQQTIIKYNGAFGKAEAPLLKKNLIAKHVMFFKQHFIPVNIKHWMFKRGSGSNFLMKRTNFVTGKLEYGHYVSTLRTIYQTLRNVGLNLPYMTSSEIKSVLYVITNVIMANIILPMIISLFNITKGGDEDEDEEGDTNYYALRKRSSYAPTLGTVDADTRFNLGQFMANGMLLVSTQMTDEYKANVPFTTTGIKDPINNIFSVDAIAIKSHLLFFNKVINFIDGSAETDPGQNNEKPYFFQQKGYENGKIIDLFFDLRGINAKFIDPVGALEDYESFKKM